MKMPRAGLSDHSSPVAAESLSTADEAGLRVAKEESWDRAKPLLGPVNLLILTRN